MARKCRQAWGAVYPGTEILSSSVPVAADDNSPDYIPPPDEASCEGSRGKKKKRKTERNFT